MSSTMGPTVSFSTTLLCIFFNLELRLGMVADQHLQKISGFVSKYATHLHDLEDALEEALSEARDFNYDPIAINITPYEQTTILQLVRTDNKILNKVMIVFSALSLEISKLNQIVSISAFVLCVLICVS